MKFSRDVLALNPELRGEAGKKARQRHEDRADTLREHLRLLAPDLYARLVRDHPFLTFRIDLADPPTMLAVEVNGGLMRAGGGKHATSRDHHKMRELVFAGWRPLVFTSSEVVHDPEMCIAAIRRGLQG